MRRTAVVLPLLLLAATGLRGQELKVEAQLTPKVIGIEQTGSLRIDVQGGGMGRLQPVPEFDLDNLEIVAGPYTQESFQFSNGTTSRSATVSWRVRPLEVGPARVRAIRVRVGDQVVQLADLRMTIQEESVEIEHPRRAQSPFDQVFEPFQPRRRDRGARQRGEVFLRATATPDRAVVGQQVLYTLYLYTQSDISSINPESLPDFQGFWVREIPQPKRYDPEMVEIEGKTFARVKLLERAIFPLRAGEFEIEPTRALMAVKVPVTTMRLSLLSQTEEIQRVSNSVTVQVDPLPPAPERFHGAVGDLALQAKLDPPTVAAGEATTLRVELSGRGLLQGLPDPELPEIPGVQVYPPQQSSTDEVRSGVVHGERTWSYVLIPEQPGPMEIPSFEVPYFHPESESFRTASTDALRLEVVPATRSSNVAGDFQIHPIRNAAIPVVQVGRHIRLLPHALMLTALLGLVVTWATRRSDRFSADHRQAIHELEHRLELAEEIDRPRQLASALEGAWCDYLRDRWEIDPSIPLNRWHTELHARGANDRASRDLERLCEDLHYLRYAPQLSSTEAIEREMVQRSRQILKALH